MTPAELLAKVTGVVAEQEEYTQALVFETLGMRWGSVELLAETYTVITLQQPLPSADYTIWRQVYTSEQEKLDVIVLNKTASTFEVWAPLACTFNYLTTKPLIL